MTNINIDKFINVKKFETAVKKLSEIVQKKDGDQFYISDIVFEYEVGLKEFYNNLNENMSILESIERNRKISRDSEGHIDCETNINPWEYSSYWKDGDNFCRINILNNEESWNYVDYGYRCID